MLWLYLSCLLSTHYDYVLAYIFSAVHSLRLSTNEFCCRSFCCLLLRQYELIISTSNAAGTINTIIAVQLLGVVQATACVSDDDCASNQVLTPYCTRFYCLHLY